ncbi:MAG TPA: sigma-70 family RNA polymerase sigma factor [Steroidobacteraceae bacterium]|nr:sigma-70 family RNA polymerase sigma factor [Steroidobacteraceae bacterium]
MRAESRRDQDQAWSQLMRAAQAGDSRAYERLLREVTPFVRALARRSCSGRHDLEEIVQETLLTVHRVRQTYDPERPFLPWLAAIASRRSIDALRRRRRIARHELSAEAAVRSSGASNPARGADGGHDPADETFLEPATNRDVEGVRAAEELHVLLQRLPARQREALESLKLKEMSLAEAAVVSGQSVGALKVNTHRALKTLRRLFKISEASDREGRGSGADGH